jgi:lipopolysaccharide/colanic/teichoic acid biosynthesis glycosyltransferase
VVQAQVDNEIEHHEYQKTLAKIPPIISGRLYLPLKRFIDYLLTIICAPAWLLVILICAILIKLDSPKGPVFFSQLRTGENGKRFKVYKFRTMVENAEELKEQLWALNEREWPFFKLTNDPRITRVGRLLRKTSLDELPQLFNVLLGQMSLVGPRPTTFDSDIYKIWQTERLDVIPGMTGLQQVYGRDEEKTDERSRMEIAYVQHRSLGLDLYLLYKTIAIPFTGKGDI